MELCEFLASLLGAAAQRCGLSNRRACLENRPRLEPSPGKFSSSHASVPICCVMSTKLPDRAKRFAQASPEAHGTFDAEFDSQHLRSTVARRERRSSARPRRGERIVTPRTACERNVFSVTLWRRDGARTLCYAQENRRNPWLFSKWIGAAKIPSKSGFVLSSH